MRNRNTPLVNKLTSYAPELCVSQHFGERWVLRIITATTFQYQAKFLSILALLTFSL